MIYKVAVKEPDNHRVFTWLHVEAIDIPMACDMAKKETDESYPGVELRVSSVEETSLNIIRRE